MFRELVEANVLYHYVLYGKRYDESSYVLGEGVVIANSEEVAREKVRKAYLDVEYDEEEFEDFIVYEIKQESLMNTSDVMEILGYMYSA